MTRVSEAIAVEGLTAFYRRHPVLTDVTISVASGEHVALMGPNGSGKTTLLRVLLGQVPFRGRVRVSGFEVRTEGEQARARLGYVPQHPSFPERLTGSEIVILWQRLRGLRPDPLSVLEGMGLAHAANQPLGTYSGGMLRRMSLALADIGDNTLMLLDEPEAGLDPEGRARLAARFEAWRTRGVTVLFTVHDGNRRLNVDRMIYLEGGVVAYEGRPEVGARLLQLEWRGPLPLLERLAARLNHLPPFQAVRMYGATEPTLQACVVERKLVEALAILHPLEPELELSVLGPSERNGWASCEPAEEALCGTSG